MAKGKSFWCEYHKRFLDTEHMFYKGCLKMENTGVQCEHLIVTKEKYYNKGSLICRRKR